MNRNLNSLAAALLLGAAAATQGASSIVTFQVDMSVQVGNGTFVPGVNHVSARGTFNGWGEAWLTNNPAGPNTNLYTGTVNDTTNPNGDVETYKFYNSRNGQWDDGAVNNSGKNRAGRLPSTSGGKAVLPVVFFGDAGPQVNNPITFQVDMAQQINTGAFDPNVHSVYARGTFNGWGLSFLLVNDPSILRTNIGGLVTSNVYVGTYDVPSGTNSSPQFKYALDPGGSWENPAATNQVGGGNGNRFFVQTGDLAGQVLPVVDFNDTPYSAVVTNDVTFQVDMSAQIAAGRFNPDAGHTVEVRGSFNGWGAGTCLLTNNPAPNANLYSTVLRIIDTKGTLESYKFEYNNMAANYESSRPKLTTPDDGPNNYNRIFNLTTTLGHPVSTVLAPVLFSDAQATDYLLTDVLVTFTVNMNGAVGSEGHVFDPTADTLWVNGEFANYNGQVGGWYPWQNPTAPEPAPPQYQMIENPPGSGIYSNTITVPKGTPLAFAYVYGMDIAISNNIFVAPYPDEPHIGDRHRVVRSTAGGPYALTPDVWGYTYSEPLFSPYAKDAGFLTIGPVSGGSTPVSWLGRPGAHLQSAPSLRGPWTDHANTDGATWTAGIASTNGLLSVTNWPATGQTHFRLVKP